MSGFGLQVLGKRPKLHQEALPPLAGSIILGSRVEAYLQPGGSVQVLLEGQSRLKSFLSHRLTGNSVT